MADEPKGDGSSTARMTELADPQTLRDREGVEVVEDERTFEEEKFEGLRRRYEVIDGVVQVGLVHDGAVLLQRTDEWAPPGGDVKPGEDWAAAARRNVAELTGVNIEIDGPELAEFTDFVSEGNEQQRFTAIVVTFRASLAKDAPGFVDEPTVPEDADLAYFDPADVELGWFDEMPDDVHPNHAAEVRLFLD